MSISARWSLIWVVCLLTGSDVISADEFHHVPPATTGPSAVASVPLPAGQAWWMSPTLESLRPEAQAAPVSLEVVIIGALQNSSEVKVFTELPLIRRTAVVEAAAAFDWRAFLDSQWRDINEPVGNTLTVGGGATRFNDQQVTARGGLRRRTLTGGEFEIAQEFGHQNTNSTFFVPNPQGTSRLTLNFTQPLLRGRGRAYNQALICLAQIDQDVAESEFYRQLQSHLIEVARAYWSLYLERGLYVQQIRSFHRARKIVDHLELRQNIDVSQAELISARASMTERRASLFRSAAAIRNAEARLRALTNDSSLGVDDTIEIIPQDDPAMWGQSATVQETIAAATYNRPEVAASLQRMKAAAVRTGLTKHELLPVLNLVTEAYVSGLQPNDPGSAFVQGFSDGSPSYTIGLQYEIPLGNRAARARHERRRLEQRQLQHEYQTTLNTIRLEVEVAVREFDTSLQEMEARSHAVTARKAQLDSLQRRWKLLPGQGVSANLALENLLAAQEQLTDAEHEHLRAITTFNLAAISLKRARGSLLQEEGITVAEYCNCCLPSRSLTKHLTITPGDSAQALMPVEVE